MNIAVLSGKGGTGKTFVSVNLAEAANNSTYIDCDVEEPNGHLFFKPNNVTEKSVYVNIPKVDKNKCIGCKKCVDFCRFNALAYTDNVLVFEDICHSCGGCSLICPTHAISEKKEEVGVVKKGISNNVNVVSGIMNVGEASGVPIIKESLKHIDNNNYNIIDCPPGSACVVMDSIKDADYCILVAEPTIFGSHNLKMVYDLVKLFNKPHGVVLNKYTNKDNPTEEFCNENNINILEKIYFDREIGNLNSDGQIISKLNDNYKAIFLSLLEKIAKEVEHEEITNP